MNVNLSLSAICFGRSSINVWELAAKHEGRIRFSSLWIRTYGPRILWTYWSNSECVCVSTGCCVHFCICLPLNSFLACSFARRICIEESRWSMFACCMNWCGSWTFVRIMQSTLMWKEVCLSIYFILHVIVAHSFSNNVCACFLFDRSSILRSRAWRRTIRCRTTSSLYSRGSWNDSKTQGIYRSLSVPHCLHCRAC